MSQLEKWVIVIKKNGKMGPSQKNELQLEKLKSVRRFLAHFESDACAGTYHTHGTLEWPKTWRADSGQAWKSFANKRSARSHS